MRKNKVEYDSHVDALVAIAKRLSNSEERNKMASEEFYDKYSKGLLEDSLEMTEWANDYRHYLAVRRKIERQLRNAA